MSEFYSNFRKPEDKELNSAATQLTKEHFNNNEKDDQQIAYYIEMLNQINNGNPSITMLPYNYNHNILTWQVFIEDKQILETNLMRLNKETCNVQSITKHVMLLKPNKE